MLFKLLQLLLCRIGVVQPSFINPYVEKGISAYNLTLTQSNRCMQYPRCILFECCSQELITNAYNYFAIPKPNLFSCMQHRNQQQKLQHEVCSYNTSIQERMQDFWPLKIKFTIDVLANGLARLPPTPPNYYELLARRSQFKVLYLVQGDYKKVMPSWYAEELIDLMYLSYKVDYNGIRFSFFLS